MTELKIGDSFLYGGREFVVVKIEVNDCMHSVSMMLGAADKETASKIQIEGINSEDMKDQVTNFVKNFLKRGGYEGGS